MKYWKIRVSSLAGRMLCLAMEVLRQGCEVRGGRDLVWAIADHQIQLMLGNVLDAAACRLHGCYRLRDALLPPPAVSCCSIAWLTSECILRNLCLQEAEGLCKAV